MSCVTAPKRCQPFAAPTYPSYPSLSPMYANAASTRTTRVIRRRGRGRSISALPFHRSPLRPVGELPLEAARLEVLQAAAHELLGVSDRAVVHRGGDLLEEVVEEVGALDLAQLHLQFLVGEPLDRSERVLPRLGGQRD